MQIDILSDDKLSCSRWEFRTGAENSTVAVILVRQFEMQRATTRHKFRIVRGWSTYQHEIRNIDNKLPKPKTLPELVAAMVKEKLELKFRIQG